MEAVMGFLEVLTLVFIAAKLAGWISWSWWIVLSPILAEGVIVLIIGLVLFFVRR
jgi:hypothetical protein